GSRPEEIREQKARVERAAVWRDHARNDLDRKRKSVVADQARLKELVTQRTAELASAGEGFTRAKNLLAKQSLSPELYRDADKQFKVAQAQLEQAEAEQRSHEAVGALEAEAELNRREKEFADVQATLALLEAGSRPEEI